MPSFQRPLHLAGSQADQPLVERLGQGGRKPTAREEDGIGEGTQEPRGLGARERGAAEQEA
jgi:hypothetical protein